MFIGTREHKYDHHRVIGRPPKYKGSHYNYTNPQ